MRVLRLDVKMCASVFLSYSVIYHLEKVSTTATRTTMHG